MKQKTMSIIALTILLFGLIYGVWLIADHTQAPVNTRDIFSLRQHKTDFKIPPQEDVVAVQNISQKLILIANPQLDPSAGIDLKLFGQNRVINQYNYKNDQAEIDVEFTYNITFTFISLENRYCYINKKFYQQGDVMPDGGRISSIETNQVLIVKNNISEWIPVQAKASAQDDPEQKE